MYSSELITPQHLARKAVIYIRRNHSGPKKLQNRVHAVYAPSHEFSPAH
jgi:hypothetical protein